MRRLHLRRPASRRDFLRLGAAGASWFLGLPLLSGCGGGGGGGGRGGGGNPPKPQSNIPNLGPLQPADANGVMLPPGFTSRIVAVSGVEPIGTSGYPWHAAPDGGATFAAPGDGWVYVSNSEVGSSNGGVGAIRFDDAGNILDAYPILTGTNDNCAGGKTPWDTWLSCEESGNGGRVYECDPFGIDPPLARPALGRFNHEAVAVDPIEDRIYLSEDRGDGRLYRFTPSNGLPDLTAGLLEVAEVLGAGPGGPVVWHPVPDPTGASTPTRYQVASSTPFDGGEWINYHGGRIYLATKGDDRIWRFDVANQSISILYDDDTSATPILTGVDNLEVSIDGDVLVAEDGGDMQIVAITASGGVVPICQLVGHDSSEITGPAFSPDSSRLYFSSQDGTTGNPSDGMTFEITGPFVV
ncbi:MAG: alkaline phosphatase PhoX [Planctomycetota bacterium]